MISRRIFLQWASAASLALGPRAARASNAPGVTDTELKIGQTMPYSGPASAYGVIGRTEAAYFKKINDEQGHLYGDSILKSVAKLLDDNVRDTDIVTRYGM